MVVRMATTEKGVKPSRIDCFPKMGVNPRKTAELKAATIPFDLFFINDCALFDQCADFVQQFVAEKITFLHQRLDMPFEAVFF